MADQSQDGLWAVLFGRNSFHRERQRHGMSGGGLVPSGARDQQGSPGARAPAIAVIVPTCGRFELLERALSSVLGQSFEDWECMVVNDAPAAGPCVDALLLKLKDARMRACHNEVNKGVAAARNEGFARTTARYLAFLDDDDYWLPDHLHGLFLAHEASPQPAIIYTDFVQRWENDIVAPRLTAAKPPPDDPGRGLLEGAFNILTMSTVSFPRCCVDDVGRFDPELKTGQDWDFYLRAASRYPFRHLEQHSVVYYHHSKNRLTSDYIARKNSLDVIMTKWQLDATFVRNKTRQWKYMAFDEMVYAASRRDLMGKYKALRNFFSFPEPFMQPVLLARLLLVAILPYPVYSAIVRWCSRDRQQAARRLLEAGKARNHGPGAKRTH